MSESERHSSRSGIGCVPYLLAFTTGRLDLRLPPLQPHRNKLNARAALPSSSRTPFVFAISLLRFHIPRPTDPRSQTFEGAANSVSFPTLDAPSAAQCSAEASARARHYDVEITARRQEPCTKCMYDRRQIPNLDEIMVHASPRGSMSKQKGIWLQDANADNARLKRKKANMRICGSLRNGMYVILLLGEETP